MGKEGNSRGRTALAELSVGVETKHALVAIRLILSCTPSFTIAQCLRDKGSGSQCSNSIPWTDVRMLNFLKAVSLSRSNSLSIVLPP
jgi:hypothetical protein